MGLFDMQGNVYEWCLDEYGEYPSETAFTVEDAPQAGVIGESGYRVVRGGSFDNRAMFVRSAYRFNVEPGYQYYSIGFRPARTLTR